MNPCFSIIPEIPDPECIESGSETISEVWIRQANQPIVLLAKTDPTETYDSQLARTIADAMTQTGPSKIYVFKVFKGTMPKISPTLKTNPQDGTVYNDITSPMKWEWTDWRNNEEIWQMYAALTGSEYYDANGNLISATVPVKVLAWAKSGVDLIGGLKGYQGTFMAEPSIEQGNEVASRIAGSFNTLIKGSVPLKIKLPA